MLQKTAKIISILTLAPAIALYVLLLLFFYDPSHFYDPLQFTLAVVFLTLLPISAYPLQPFIPSFRDGGRDAQRKLAFVMAVTGYTLGIFCAALFGATARYFTVYAAYFLSGLVLTFFNKVLKIKASGHACGVAGPLVLCFCYLGGWSFLLALILPAVYWSRLQMGRHKLSELFIGSAVSTVCTLAAVWVIG